MTFPPWLALAALLTLTVALVYQLIRKRFGWRVVGYWGVVFIGFMGAELIAEAAGWSLTRLGDLRLGPDVLGAFAGVGTLRLFRL